MTTTLIIIIVAVVAVIALLAAFGTGGPRVIHIDRTVRKDKESGE